ncbi:LytR family transcriptional regulator [Salegentibacter salinarum]|uniref:LytR family transcriptional regulator n=1 Tax=Salegentibacter salinarum TaxID=447422 RepID=A0A2N0U1H1_9FLAO|nr:LytTR family DNA-binding domain-containing protein [Salegentibacter salinarum]PKD20850.1 LytR family transcriptional regulator [Salegentibacter salinarum]SKB78636.1 two component transcriptional regulator, LytTR family [Salegentibacter salinarum]
MKVAILDDEVHCVEGLVLHLRKNFPDAEIIYKGTRPEAALEVLPNAKIDLLFLDVEMPGMNGFELLDQLQETKFDVIFTTAYSQYAAQAFKAKAVNYLLKPIDEIEFREAILDWQEERKKKNNFSSEKISDLLTYMRREGILKNKIALPVADGYEFIETNEILYAQSQNNYTQLFLSDKRNLVLSKTLKEFEKLLDKYFFIRIHKSYLINPNYMKKYYKNDGGYLVMQDGKTIPVSKTKKDLITSLFDAITKTS